MQWLLAFTHMCSSCFLWLFYTVWIKLLCRGFKLLLQELIVHFRSVWWHGTNCSVFAHRKVCLLRMFVEYCTAVDVLFVGLRHRSCTRLWSKDSVVAISLQLRQEETVELFCLYFLQPQQQKYGNLAGVSTSTHTNTHTHRHFTPFLRQCFDTVG